MPVCKVSHIYIAFKAQLLRHTAANVAKSYIYGVQFVGYALVQVCPRLESGFTDGAVGGLHIFQQSVKIAVLAVEFDGTARGKLCVFLSELALFNSVVYNAFVRKADFRLEIFKHIRAELPPEVRLEGRGKQRLVRLFCDKLEFWELLVKEVHFPVVKFVAGVGSVAYRGNGIHCGNSVCGFIVFD